MPLMIMSPNITERDSPSSRKRSHEEFTEKYDSDAAVKTKHQPTVAMVSADKGTALPPHVANAVAHSPPTQSSPSALTDAGSSTPADGPASPSTPSRQPLLPIVPANNSSASSQPPTMPPAGTALPTGQGPPKKRKKLTPAERKAKEEEDAARKAEREKKILEREAQKKLDEEKRQQRLAEKQAAQAEKVAEIEAKKKAKEERRFEQEKREREKKEEAERKARAQTKIASFFVKKDPVMPKRLAVVDNAVKARSPSPAAVQTEYAKLALPFFVHTTVTMAKTPFAVDEETREAKTQILTDHLEGRRPPVATKPFDPLTRLQLTYKPSPRGKSFPCVKDMLTDQDGGSSSLIDPVTESLNLPTRQSLKSVPMKQLSFHEDVRPAYYGTVTSVQSVAKLRKMARNPIAKDLPLNYDYDSEAEWVQGEEEEEEAIDEMTDDEDEEDDSRSLNEFLDDEDDVGRPTGRLIMGNLEPETTGICFEDRKRANPNPQMYKFRMEFLIPDLEHHHSIDPFCTTYWPSTGKTASSTSPGQAKTKAGEKAAKPNASDKVTKAAMPPPPAPATNQDAGAGTSKVPDPVLDMVPAHQMEDFKAAVMQFKFLAKSALLPTLKKQFDRCSKDQIKTTLEHVAEKHGRKDWELKQST
ncbi:chromatin assembly factor-I (CAF-I) p90 subunit [Gnomoniopsis sp. IMI 355080]|nr:chromatin assembly factor-I (CAF-I) p90 subunit [Gnomoniopsis sp. IMI 355080]